MYSNNPRRSVSAQPSYPKNPYFMPEDEAKKPALIFLILCILLPPFGMLCAWRSRRMTFPLRIMLSGAGFISMTLIFFLLMRPTEVVSTIRPTPALPQTVGYGAAAASDPSVQQVPAQPDAVIPAQPDAATPPNSYSEPLIQNSGELTEDSIVFAVTNNASSYHLYEICDLQQNNRALSLRDALNEGLQPCSKCVGAAE